MVYKKTKRGRCRVFHYQDILEAKFFKPFADTFFSILTYNPDARRLANTQGEIRVGASHQAHKPECLSTTTTTTTTTATTKTTTKTRSSSSLETEEEEQENKRWETVVWSSQHISDENLLTYLQAARSIAAFAGMCDRGNAEDMYDAAQDDSITANALDKLHEMDYDTSRALQCLVKQPLPKGFAAKKWTDEDQVKPSNHI